MTASVLVVGFAAGRPLSPRGERVQALVAELEKRFRVELCAGAGGSTAVPSRPSRRRRLVGDLARLVVLDRDELESARVFRASTPIADAALLIGSPFSPMVWAARRLVRGQVPYVVDIGDPWALTNAKPSFPTVARARALRAERFLWQHARGGIVTTTLQAESLRALFRDLPILVQPNGFTPVPSAVSLPGSRDASRLSVVHYGDLYEPRLDVVPFLRALSDSGKWRQVSFTLYGVDWNHALSRLRAPVEVRTLAPVPWTDVVATASDHDVALVVGNRNPAQLPSKAVQYLTLPIPRVALVNGHAVDALAGYVASKPAWLTLSYNARGSDWIDQFAAHVQRRWTASELEPPLSEAWPTACRRIVEFFSVATGLG
jgi:hypothetical protein